MSLPSFSFANQTLNENQSILDLAPHSMFNNLARRACQFKHDSPGLLAGFADTMVTFFIDPNLDLRRRNMKFMKPLIALSIASAMSLPVMATENQIERQIDNQPESQVENTEEALGSIFPVEEPTSHEFRPHRPPPRPPRPPRGPRPPRMAWICLARDAAHYGYRYVDYDLAWARHGALRECHYRTPVGRCYLVGCDRY